MKGETSPKGKQARGNGKSATLGTNSEIGRKLKQYYDELLTDDVPERFTELLRQLEESEQDRSARQGD